MPSLLFDMGRVLWALPRVEVGRLTCGPAPLLRQLRARGGGGLHRTPEQRRRLRKLIAWVDGRLPGGGNCYRRSLLETALDPGAAAEPLLMGLDASGRPRSGHAWLASHVDADVAGRYDTVIAL